MVESSSESPVIIVQVTDLLADSGMGWDSRDGKRGQASNTL